MNHAQKIVYLGNLLRTNLDAKGVTVNQNATMKEMIDSILDIPPVTVGISLSSSLNLSVPSNIKYYDTVVLTATLTVFYDDTSQTNVDMHGTLQGATVIFKDGQNNTIGSAITDINGVATYNITANSSSMEYYAVFSGTDDYSSSTSNHVTINPQHDYNLEFSQDIYLASSGSATVSCTLTDNGVPVPNATVSLSGSDGSLYTGITNNNGVFTLSINPTNNINITANYSNTTTTCSIVINNILFEDMGVTGNYNSNYIADNGVTATIYNDGTDIRCTVYSDSLYKANVIISGDFKISYYLAEKTTDSGGFFLTDLNNNKKIISEFTTGHTHNFEIVNGSSKISTYDNPLSNQIVCVREGSTIKMYENDTLKSQHNNFTTEDLYFGWKTHSASGRHFKFYNLIIEQL